MIDLSQQGEECHYNMTEAFHILGEFIWAYEQNASRQMGTQRWKAGMPNSITQIMLVIFLPLGLHEAQNVWQQ